MIKLNGGIGKPYADQYKPFIHSFFVPAGYYASNGNAGSVLMYNGMHAPISSADGGYFLIPVFKSESETILDLSYTKGTNRPIFDIYISNNGVDYLLDTSGVDSYSGSTSVVCTSINLTIPLVNGWNVVKLLANGKNESSSGYGIAVQGVRLR